ncbi:MAG: hypothetical protein LBJ00_11520 [Planctomycetaceae bacterium]|nr:hypothetical protein [Planctomycetaceae bacterium]
MLMLVYNKFANVELDFQKFNSQTQRCEAVAQKRGLSHILVWGLFLVLSMSFIVGCMWDEMPPSPDDSDNPNTPGGTTNPGYVEPMFPLGDAGIFLKDEPPASTLPATPEKNNTNKKTNKNEEIIENEKIPPTPNIDTKPIPLPTSPPPPATDNNKQDNTRVLRNTNNREVSSVQIANLNGTNKTDMPEPVWEIGFALEQPLRVAAFACPASGILKQLEYTTVAPTTSQTTTATTKISTEKNDNKTQNIFGMSFLIDDLVDQVDEYVKRIGDNLDELKTSSNYMVDRDSVYRDSSGLMLVVLAIGLSDKDSRYRASASEVLVALKRLIATAEYKSALSEFDAVKSALGNTKGTSKLKLEKVVQLKPVMKAMPNLNSNVRRLTNTEAKLKRQLDKNPKQIFGQLAALAAISECSIPNADETSKPNELTKWRTECEQFRDVAIKANAAAHDFANGKIKYENYWSAFSELTRSCDSCHKTFYPDAVGAGN